MNHVLNSNKNGIVLIPAYKPGPAMVKLVKELKCFNLEIIIVNDGSGSWYDVLFEDVEKMATVLRHEKNRGKGAAIKTGLSYISEHYTAPYIVATADADGQHKTGDILNVMQAASGDRDCLFLGSRHFSGKVPLRSRLGNSITRFVFRAASGTAIYDTQTGLRAFSDVLVSRLLEISGERYEYEMNVLMSFAAERRPIREIWIETIYLDNNVSSHFDAVRDSLRIYKEILAFSAASLLSFFTDYSLFCLLMAEGGNLVFSNITARIVSATLNYLLNRKLVFKSDAPVMRSTMQYAALAAAVLAGNTLLVHWFTLLGWSHYLAKIAAEIFLFAFSWTMQRCVIFRRNSTVWETGEIYGKA